MSIAEMIKKLTQLIQTTYGSDPTDPGLTLSRPKPHKVYAAVVRFNKPFGKEKWTALKASNRYNARGVARFDAPAQSIIG